MASQARRGTGRGGARGGHPPTAAQGAQGAERPPLYPDLSRNVGEAVRIHSSLNVPLAKSMISWWDFKTN
ncbi:hypothetical protein HWV62_7216 [Athelia sp. TMB]|nr:hypothetical protein HWV62_7216 [Athelia sp. TMB]